MEQLFSLDDIVLSPAIFSEISHRAQCCPYVGEHEPLPETKEMLPLFTAPMSSVISDENFNEFKSAGINTIIPRNVHINTRLRLAKDTFVALGLEEFSNLIKESNLPHKMYILVDVANGHMKSLYDMAKEAKEKFKDELVLMVGNIANPETYVEYSRIGVDFVRCGIGTGNVCTTSANSSIHYPMGSLLANIEGLKCFHTAHDNNIKWAKIVADGGFNNFDQINKALALGADYVMLGKIFAKTKEACGKILSSIYPNYSSVPFEEWCKLKDIKTLKYYECFRYYYGMSTKIAQKEFGKEGDKTAEGIKIKVPIEYTIAGWVDNFKHYLQSAMSYTNCTTLEEFKTSVDYYLITPNARLTYYK